MSSEPKYLTNVDDIINFLNKDIFTDLSDADACEWFDYLLLNDTLIDQIIKKIIKKDEKKYLTAIINLGDICCFYKFGISLSIENGIKGEKCLHQITKYNIPQAFHILGQYYNYGPNGKKYDLAIKYYEKAIKYSHKLDSSYQKRFVNNINSEIGTIYYLQYNKPKTALKYLNDNDFELESCFKKLMNSYTKHMNIHNLNELKNNYPYLNKRFGFTNYIILLINSYIEVLPYHPLCYIHLYLVRNKELKKTYDKNLIKLIYNYLCEY